MLGHTKEMLCGIKPTHMLVFEPMALQQAMHRSLFCTTRMNTWQMRLDCLSIVRNADRIISSQSDAAGAASQQP